MTLNVIIDAPDTAFSSTEEWQTFLEEMIDLLDDASDIDTAQEAQRYIDLANTVLAERRITKME